jgi:peptidoglycan hydrolase-like protein with peptidoglycan-binding domain
MKINKFNEYLNKGFVRMFTVMFLVVMFTSEKVFASELSDRIDKILNNFQNRLPINEQRLDYLQYGSGMRTKDGLPAVKALQQMLKDSGIDKDLEVDGKFGRDTMEALKDFQTSRGLTPDGVMGPRTSAELRGSIAPEVAKTATDQMIQAAPTAVARAEDVHTNASAGNVGGQVDSLTREIDENINSLEDLANELRNDPGNSDLLNSYNDAVKSIAGKVGDLERAGGNTDSAIDRLEQVDKSFEGNNSGQVANAENIPKSLEVPTVSEPRFNIPEQQSYSDWVKEMVDDMKSITTKAIENAENAIENVENAARDIFNDMFQPSESPTQESPTSDLSEYTDYPVEMKNNFDSLSKDMDSLFRSVEANNSLVGGTLKDIETRIGKLHQAEEAQLGKEADEVRQSLNNNDQILKSLEDKIAKMDPSDPVTQDLQGKADMLREALDEAKKAVDIAQYGDPSKQGGKEKEEDKFVFQCEDPKDCKKKPSKLILRCTEGEATSCTRVIQEAGETGGSAPGKETVVTPGVEGPATPRFLAKDEDVVLNTKTGKYELKSGKGTKVGPNDNDVVGKPPEYVPDPASP